jgi:hypothetical protein
MPKGWVIITDSSEETGGEEEERGEELVPPNQALAAEIHNQAPPTQPAIPDVTKTQVEGYLTLSADLGSVSVAPSVPAPASASVTASVTASTPSLVHTPSSRADSTPAQGVETPPEDQAKTSPWNRDAVDPPKYDLSTPPPPAESPSVLTPKQPKNNGTEDETTPRARSCVNPSAEVPEADPVDPPLITTEESTSVALTRMEYFDNAAGTDSVSDELPVQKSLVTPEVGISRSM